MHKLAPDLKAIPERVISGFQIATDGTGKTKPGKCEKKPNSDEKTMRFASA